MLYPLTFQPIFKERIWGGRNLERLYAKPLPAHRAIGESWEITDRPGDVSVITNGPLAGKDLRWLMEHHADELLGPARSSSEDGFPLLIKIIDAHQTLSLQVHPPADKAATLGGEPKTELWYVAEAEPSAELFVGLKRGVNRRQFEEKIRDGSVADCFHRLRVKQGDAMFLPSGRVHALGAGIVIFEIQQNSDTTYRVFDWNRLDAHGQPRPLHVAESLASIDFADFEPQLVPAQWLGDEQHRTRPLVHDPLFSVELHELQKGSGRSLSAGAMTIVGVVTGNLNLAHRDCAIGLSPGEFCLVPASAGAVSIDARQNAQYLWVRAGTAG